MKLQKTIHRIGEAEIVHFGTEAAINKTRDRLEEQIRDAKKAAKAMASMFEPTVGAFTKTPKRQKRVNPEEMIATAYEIYVEGLSIGRKREETLMKVVSHFQIPRNHACQLIKEAREKYLNGSRKRFENWGDK